MEQKWLEAAEKLAIELNTLANGQKELQGQADFFKKEAKGKLKQAKDKILLDTAMLKQEQLEHEANLKAYSNKIKNTKHY